jgi:hypothetical protein
MGIGSGVGLIIAGAILTWAIELDVPYLYEGALGVIMMIAGLAVIAVTVAVHPRAYSSVGTGLALATAGAIFTWAVEIDLPYVYDGSLGVILLAAGLIGVIAAIVMDFQRQRSRQVVEYRHPDGSRYADGSRYPEGSRYAHGSRRTSWLPFRG